jgi:hypothetical protein
MGADAARFRPARRRWLLAAEERRHRWLIAPVTASEDKMTEQKRDEKRPEQIAQEWDAFIAKLRADPAFVLVEPRSEGVIITGLPPQPKPN